MIKVSITTAIGGKQTNGDAALRAILDKIEEMTPITQAHIATLVAMLHAILAEPGGKVALSLVAAEMQAKQEDEQEERDVMAKGAGKDGR